MNSVSLSILLMPLALISGTFVFCVLCVSPFPPLPPSAQRNKEARRPSSGTRRIEVPSSQAALDRRISGAGLRSEDAGVLLLVAP